jgi:hypothetical protein
LWLLLTISDWLPWGAALRKTIPRCVWPSMTEWSGSEFTYRSNAASNQATKTKLHWLQVIPPSKHQHCLDDNCDCTNQSCCGEMQFCGTRSPGASNPQWLSGQGQSSCTVVTLHPTKPQRQSCAGFKWSHKANANTARMTTAIALTVFSLAGVWFGGRRSPCISYYWWGIDQFQSSIAVCDWHCTSWHNISEFHQGK